MKVFASVIALLVTSAAVASEIHEILTLSSVAEAISVYHESQDDGDVKPACAAEATEFFGCLGDEFAGCFMEIIKDLAEDHTCEMLKGSDFCPKLAECGQNIAEGTNYTAQGEALKMCATTSYPDREDCGLCTIKEEMIVVEVSLASAAYDVSSVNLDSNSSDSVAVDYPAVLADDADEWSSPVSPDLAFDLTDLHTCSNDDDCSEAQIFAGYTCINGRCVIGPNKPCNAVRDKCVSDFTCLGGICQRGRTPIGPPPARIPAGAYCRAGIDICTQGYSCKGGKCSPTRIYIGPGEVCQPHVDVCENGYSCLGGRCVIPAIPQGGNCHYGGKCSAGYSCYNDRCQKVNGRNSSSNTQDYGSGQWYTNGQYCVMDCPSTDGACCGGSAQSWDHTYGSTDACCGQSSFQGNREGCLNRSLQCDREDYVAISLS